MQGSGLLLRKISNGAYSAGGSFPALRASSINCPIRRTARLRTPGFDRELIDNARI
jgi:hypothetical protein